MVILIVLLAIISPRLLLFLMWLFDYSAFNAAYSGFLLPFLGFLFLPITTMMYVFAYSPETGVSGFGWLVMALAVISDFSAYGGTKSRRR